MISGAPCRVSKTLAIKIGEHNEQVYSALLGYTEQQIEQLRQRRAI